MIGWFPTSFIRLKVNQPTQPGSGCNLTPKNLKTKHRNNIAKEILETERTYVRHLRGKPSKICQKSQNLFRALGKRISESQGQGHCHKSF